MRKCPRCGEDAMSVLGKMCLGMARSPKCRNCGKRVSVPKSSFYVQIAVLIPAGAWAVASEYETLPVMVAVAVFVVAGWYHYAKVPLIKR